MSIIRAVVLLCAFTGILCAHIATGDPWITTTAASLWISGYLLGHNDGRCTLEKPW